MIRVSLCCVLSDRRFNPDLTFDVCRYPDRQRPLSQTADHQDLHPRRRTTGDWVQNPRQIQRSVSHHPPRPFRCYRRCNKYTLLTWLTNRWRATGSLLECPIVLPLFLPPGQFVPEHHTLPGHKSHLMAPDHLGGIEFDMQLLWSAQTFDSPYQLWRATSSYSRSAGSSAATIRMWWNKNRIRIRKL